MRANKQRYQSITIIRAILFIFLSGYTSFAAKNPLASVPAHSFDVKGGEVITELSIGSGSDLTSIHDGNFVIYRNYDFDSGVAGFTARIASTNSGCIEIRLDSPTGALMGRCQFGKTGGWQKWADVSTQVDNSQAGVRDICLTFHGDVKGDLLHISSFVFCKSLVTDRTQIMLGAPERTDFEDDEPQATNSWGIPEAGFTDNFEGGRLYNWVASGISITTNAIVGNYSVESQGTNYNYALTPNVYINKTDTGGEWRTLAEASLAADIVIDSPYAQPGIGFTSKDAKQSVYVVLNAANNSIVAWQKLADGSLMEIAKHPKYIDAAVERWKIRPGVKYRLIIDWSPYSDGLIIFLNDDKGASLTSFRTVIDLPGARRPLIVCSGGKARFDNVKFDPSLDGWNFKWQWKKSPILTPDVCNPAVWKGKDEKFYMMWRKFGQDTYHGIASSVDGINWTRLTDKVLKCTGDMNVVIDPFGDGMVYITPGGNKMPWFVSDGTQNYTNWKDTGLNLGDIYGNNRIQEIIDTKRYPQMTPVLLNGVQYRFIGFTENWVDEPKPHTVILLSNTLTNWVLANPEPLIPPGTEFWGEKGNAIGAALVLPDGNILVASCSCTFDGYTGASEPSNVSAIVDGKKPWVVLAHGILPDAPVSRERVWYQGPNFRTAFNYDSKNDTLFFYGGFHDYHIGIMRVQDYSHSLLFHHRITVSANKPQTNN